MTMVVETQASLDLLLRHLVDQELDAVEAYGTAVSCAKSEAHGSVLSLLRDQHARHAEELGERLYDLGGELPKGPDLKRVLSQGKVVLASLKGDGAMLVALKASEDQARAAYERACHDEALPLPMRALMTAYLVDEERFTAALEDLLGREQAHESATSRPSH